MKYPDKTCGLDVLNTEMCDVWNALYDSETNMGRGSRGDTITLKWCAFVQWKGQMIGLGWD